MPHRYAVMGNMQNQLSHARVVCEKFEGETSCRIRREEIYRCLNFLSADNHCSKSLVNSLFYRYIDKNYEAFKICTYVQPNKQRICQNLCAYQWWQGNKLLHENDKNLDRTTRISERQYYLVKNDTQRSERFWMTLRKLVEKLLIPS